MWTKGWRIIWEKIIAVVDAPLAVPKRKPVKNLPKVHTTHLLDLMVYQLARLIKEPTRVNAKSQTLIDVFITNKEDNI